MFFSFLPKLFNTELLLTIDIKGSIERISKFRIENFQNVLRKTCSYVKIFHKSSEAVILVMSFIYLPSFGKTRLKSSGYSVENKHYN